MRVGLERVRLLLLKERRPLRFLVGLTARRLNVERLTRDGVRLVAGRLGATDRRGVTLRVLLMRWFFRTRGAGALGRFARGLGPLVRPIEGAFRGGMGRLPKWLGFGIRLRGLALNRGLVAGRGVARGWLWGRRCIST